MRRWLVWVAAGQMLLTGGCGQSGARDGGGAGRDESSVRRAARRWAGQLEQYYRGRMLTGYGGRRFTIEIEPAVAVVYRPAGDGGAGQAGRFEPGPGVEMRLVHWQVQPDARMKYRLTVEGRWEQGRWQVVAMRNLYLGLDEGKGFEPAGGFRAIDVMPAVRGNVYAGPVQRIFEQVFNGSARSSGQRANGSGEGETADPTGRRRGAVEGGSGGL